MGCDNSTLDFREYTSVFQVLNKIEIESKRFQELKLTMLKDSDEYRLYDSFCSKTSSILRFLKNKPLMYVEERLSTFKELINRYHYSIVTVNISEFESSQSELEEFIFRMMDYYNGIRISIPPKEKSSFN